MPASIQTVPMMRPPWWNSTTLSQTSTDTTRPKTAGSGTRAPATGTESGTRKALGRSPSRKRRTITDRCAIANEIIAPKANTPARNSRSWGMASANAISAARQIATYGVPRRRWRRPTALGICRLVASE